jgi:small subunit ribosomal protein S16
MSVKIRLTRMGRHSDPFYRIVAADSRFARDGRYIEQIGVYDPKKGLEGAEIDETLARKWLAAGAIPSDSIRAMFAKKGLNAKAVKATKAAAPKEAKAKGAK